MITEVYLGIVALIFCLAGDVYVTFSKRPTDARSPQGPTGTRSTPAPADQRPAGPALTTPEPSRSCSTTALIAATSVVGPDVLATTDTSLSTLAEQI